MFNLKITANRITTATLRHIADSMLISSKMGIYDGTADESA